MAIMMRLHLRLDGKRETEKSAYGIRLLHFRQAADLKDSGTVAEALVKVKL